MTDDPKTTFEFDPLPGDAAAEPPKPTEPVPKKQKAVKPERKKKRGPRRVEPQAAAPILTGMQEARIESGFHEGAATAPKPSRKKREAKADLAPEFDFIRRLMAETEPTRRRIMAVLNKVFG